MTIRLCSSLLFRYNVILFGEKVDVFTISERVLQIHPVISASSACVLLLSRVSSRYVIVGSSHRLSTPVYEYVEGG